MTTLTPIADATTDRLLRAVTALLEQYRENLDGDPFLQSVRIELRIITPYEEPRQGREVGDVRSCTLQHQSEVKPA